MTEEGRLPINDADSPSPTGRGGGGLERMQEKCGLTWRGLAARIGVNHRAGLSRADFNRHVVAGCPGQNRRQNPDKETEEELPMTFDNDNYEPSLSKGYPPPPLPEDWWARLGRLEDRTGVSLEDFTRRWGLPLERANRLRFHDVPTAAEMRAILEWACTVRGGVEVLLRDSDEPWPYRR